MSTGSHHWYGVYVRAYVRLCVVRACVVRACVHMCVNMCVDIYGLKKATPCSPVFILCPLLRLTHTSTRTSAALLTQLASCVSISFILVALYPVLKEYGGGKHLFLSGLIVLNEVLLAVLLKIYFFSTPST